MVEQKWGGGRSTPERRLDDAIADLERLLEETPKAGEWLARLRATLAEASGAVHAHVLTSEQRGGLLDQVEDETPLLAREAARLRREHDELSRQITALEGAADAMDEGDGFTERQLRLELMQLVRSLVAHRHRGSELMHRAFNVDLGAGD